MNGECIYRTDNANVAPKIPMTNRGWGTIMMTVSKIGNADYRLTGRSLRVLVADDNRVNQLLMTLLLELRGHSVKLAVNGKEAVAAFDKDSFDIVLMDVQMPEISGLDATKLIREKHRASGEHVPIIALTACTMRGDRERCLEAGMDDYLTKPVVVEEIFQAIARWVPDSVSMPRPTLAPILWDHLEIVDPAKMRA
jgi:CheY-like chemotaxis protein